MVDTTTISEIDIVKKQPFNGTEEIEIEDGGVTKKITTFDLFTLFGRKKKTVDESRSNSIIIVPDSELIFEDLPINTMFFYRFYGKFVCSSLAVGLRSSFTLPFGSIDRFRTQQAIRSDLSQTIQNSSVELDNVSVINIPSDSTIFGWFETGANVGDFSFNWSQNASNPIPMTFEKGAILELIKI